MNLADIMDELATKLRGIPELNVSAFPPGRANPPQAIVSYPERIVPLTYAAGAWKIEALSIALVVGPVTGQSTRDRLAAYVAPTGARSVRAALETGPYTTFDDLMVTSIEFGPPVTIADNDYLAGLFNVDIVGS